MLQLLKTLADCDQFRQTHKNITVALVPTMGNLHQGHLALVRLAKRHAELVVVSIFVNPTQFGPTEDFDRYPRTLDADLRLLEAEGVNAVFTPTVETLYPKNNLAEGFQLIAPVGLTQNYCGASRPGHFEGVCQVVLKLFNLLGPQVAIFGEKDAQQLAVLQAMVEAYNVPVQIIPHSVVREADGLAKSSRNQYLQTEEERQASLGLIKTLHAVQQKVQTSPTPLKTEVTFEEAWQAIQPTLPQTPQLKWEYWAAAHPETLEPQAILTPGLRLLVAARVGSVRLIDTLLLAP